MDSIQFNGYIDATAFGKHPGTGPRITPTPQKRPQRVPLIVSMHLDPVFRLWWLSAKNQIPDIAKCTHGGGGGNERHQSMIFHPNSHF